MSNIPESDCHIHLDPHMAAPSTFYEFFVYNTEFATRELCFAVRAAIGHPHFEPFFLRANFHCRQSIKFKLFVGGNMAHKQRLEDIGRMMLMLEKILDHDLFNEDKMESKGFEQWFWNQSSEKQSQVLRSFAYGLDEIEDMIGEVFLISKGQDEFNGT